MSSPIPGVPSPPSFASLMTPDGLLTTTQTGSHFIKQQLFIIGKNITTFFFLLHIFDLNKNNLKNFNFFLYYMKITRNKDCEVWKQENIAKTVV